MTELSEILTAFEQALILENELGTRTVDIDRTLLVPIIAKKEEPKVEEVKARPNPEVVAKKAVEDKPCVHAEEVAACTDCKCACVGEGKTDSPDFMFIGDFPSADENGNIHPFAGAEGELIEKIITAGMKYNVEDVFRTTVCKYVPKNKRMPRVKELASCVEILKKQIQQVRPRVIILFGKDTMDAFPLAQKMVQNKWYKYNDFPLVALWHPKEIFRVGAESQRAAKLEIWNAVKTALSNIGK